MASSSFDVSFRIQTKADAQVFMKALEEADSNTQSEMPRAKSYKGDLTEVNKKILERYGKRH